MAESQASGVPSVGQDRCAGLIGTVDHARTRVGSDVAGGNLLIPPELHVGVHPDFAEPVLIRNNVLRVEERSVGLDEVLGVAGIEHHEAIFLGRQKLVQLRLRLRILQSRGGRGSGSSNEVRRDA